MNKYEKQRPILSLMRLRQDTYRDWVLGTLVYVVVLSLFNDYANVIDVSSASTILFASLILQALTFWTLGFKKWLGSQFNYPKNKKFRPAKFLSLWAVLFFSKFIFLWVIEVVFGRNFEISGFVGLMVIVLAMTIIKELLFYFDNKLENSVETRR